MSWSSPRRNSWDRPKRMHPYGHSSWLTKTTEDGRILNPPFSMLAAGQLISYTKRGLTGYWTGPYMARVVSEQYRLKTDTGEDLLNPKVFVGTLYPEGWKTS